MEERIKQLEAENTALKEQVKELTSYLHAMWNDRDPAHVYHSALDYIKTLENKGEN